MANHDVDKALLIENPYIIGWRKNYINQIRYYRRMGYYIVYLDESYVSSIVSFWTLKQSLIVIVSGKRTFDAHQGAYGHHNPFGCGGTSIAVGSFLYMAVF